MDWYLIISTYLPVGGHLYGKLEPAGRVDRTVYVDRFLTREAARRLNRDDGGRNDYRTGEVTERFHNRDDLIAHAIDQWRAVAAPGDVLRSGSPLLPDRDVLARHNPAPEPALES